MKIKIGNKEFKVRVAKDDNEKTIGLSQTVELPKKEGFVMQFDSEEDIPITMEAMKYPLDVIFANGGKITKVVTANPGDVDIRSGSLSDLILELNTGEGSDFKPGDEIKLIGEKLEDGTVEMAEGGLAAKGERHVLDEDGKNQMNLKGGERIFSRKATNRMFDLAKKGDAKKLGKFLINEITAQDSRPTEYSKN